MFNQQSLREYLDSPDIPIPNDLRKNTTTMIPCITSTNSRHALILKLELYIEGLAQ